MGAELSIGMRTRFGSNYRYWLRTTRTSISRVDMKRMRTQYSDLLDQTISDLEDRIRWRDQLNAEIVKLSNTVRIVSEIVQENEGRTRRLHALLDWADITGPSLVGTVRVLLRDAGERGMTAIEMRDALQTSGFDSSVMTNLLASVHTTLKRLLVRREASYGNDRDGKRVYAWARSCYVRSSGFANPAEDQRRDERSRATEDGKERGQRSLSTAARQRTAARTESEMGEVQG